ncbi:MULTISPECIES: winged helix-turn-helix domain-containing protein [unclassified Lentimonas]|uniref:winged helix-turn-helix domain-containing protein n=1 Tax=unclassified Lentimonas TaxID=2630993 RepID=UPI0013299D72|nr:MULTISPECIES: winged helix-turn-helix domain-containing protein [unclassified Lentimonas]CAA6677365.1 Unannotated [Lentimonas sp. CC4]CAA6686910.1 Unannotated [Lentimonas sp. CC6]CAA6690093.1 Unannotated [Lentimonas sp. CC19]CAA6690947.1 Unannotated [Lentimonas sp. CC10]CAA7070703.1 Unannotated [Lentimonas sp. CC11]
MHKARQQRFALRVALYVLRHKGCDQPTKNQVLNFMIRKRFIQIPEEEMERRRDSDREEIWRNDLCWKRKDLFEDGEVDSPERGKWSLTKHGISKIETSKEQWLKLSDLDEQRRVLEQLDYFTPELIQWLLKIARGDDLSRRAIAHS